MARPENRDYTRDSCIRWSPERGLLIVEEKKEDGVISCQQIDPFDLYCALNEGYNNKDFLSSGFLPEHCLSVAMNGSERYFVLWNPELRADLTYLNTEYPDFPLPRLVFGIRMLNTGRIAECSIGVAADESGWTLENGYSYIAVSGLEDSSAATPMNPQGRRRRCMSIRSPTSIRTGSCVRAITSCPDTKIS